jgi:hypothetical protein
MGAERSLAKVGDQGGKSHKYIQRLSAEYRWVARAAAWDDEQRRIEDEEMASARKAAVRRHVQLGKKMQEAGAKRLYEKSFHVVSPRDVASLIKNGAALESAALGLSRPEQPTVQVNVGLLAQLERDTNALRVAGNEAFNKALSEGKSEQQAFQAMKDACERLVGPLHSQPVVVDSTAQHDACRQLPEPRSQEPSE